ncbi:MAG: bifunctional precorrin-2 dehydrogenase/sirohydrochlorin ferrochelatase [Armatimonadetes bacterium]|nr:bifunctional precorrin-2 dehydrogenase/sirohydrochlorin ferrochelatase [Armatimonadota bacterium]
MSYYTIAIDITGRKCLVVGGGEVALRKTRSLLEAGAHVIVIASAFHPQFRSIESVELIERDYQQGDCAGCTLVFAATNDPTTNEAVARDAKSIGALVNVVDDPSSCSFIAPAVVRRGDLIIAITTCGKSPALSRRIRMELEERYGPEYSLLVDLLGELRELVKSKYKSQKDRERIFDMLLESDILDLLRREEVEKAKESIVQRLL